jgi:hypothetical protein
LQFAGYALAEFTATPDDPSHRQLPRWERFGVLHLTDGAESDWEVIPFVVNAGTYEAFASALRLHNWRKTNTGSIKGEPIKSKGARP